ncbi:hypothetical protein M404DRAFT_187866 [Pisolithus tinctorius Marx 270]|uniref:Uncharacterized protein n=1 Tax=Pisolithus tinctorius Marx 270 TaxID=870435 RepID=A0A0C3PZE9_PISTI|nr:hypothetical protein M404DRAFT_187866 [Pisolithus tinctorius Marx 270]
MVHLLTNPWDETGRRQVLEVHHVESGSITHAYPFPFKPGSRPITVPALMGGCCAIRKQCLRRSNGTRGERMVPRNSKRLAMENRWMFIPYREDPGKRSQDAAYPKPPARRPVFATMDLKASLSFDTHLCTCKHGCEYLMLQVNHAFLLGINVFISMIHNLRLNDLSDDKTGPHYSHPPLSG